MLAHVDPEILCQREPLADEDNALGPWMEAIKALTPSVELEASCDTEFCCSEPALPSLKLPADASGQACRENVAANRPSLDHVEVGIDRGRFQLAELRGPDGYDGDLETLLGLRDLVRLRNHYVCVLATDGEGAAAGRVLLRSLTMTEMLLHGDGYVLHFLMAVGLRGSVLSSIREFAFLRGAPAKETTELLAALARDVNLGAWQARSVRRD
ncbi:MAG TPA: hypothetical protein PK867_18415, partial [Pirellulales bacterium]|nr:hypothetical protein [Pirellulales bacterium]